MPWISGPKLVSEHNNTDNGEHNHSFEFAKHFHLDDLIASSQQTGEMGRVGVVISLSLQLRKLRLEL